MMNRLHVFLISLLLLGVLCTSCVREVVMDAGEKPVVVVECVISNNPVQTLHLRYTKGASKKEYEVVTEAEAVLHDLTEGTVAGSFVKSSDGVWTLDYAAIDDHEYRLEVNVPTYETITAEQKMPVRPVARAERLCSMKLFPTIHTHLELEKGCAYRVSSSAIGRNLWIYAMNYNRETGKRETAEYICGNSRFSENNLTDVMYSPQIDTVSYVVDVGKYGSMIYTVECGLYLGLSGRKMHEKYLRTDTIKEDTFVFSELVISGTFKGFYPVEFVSEDSEYIVNDGVIEEPADDQGYLVFAVVSDEYEKYHDEALRFQALQESSQLSDIYLRDNVYTNINGALGIFGAKAETKMVWSDSPIIGKCLSVVKQESL